MTPANLFLRSALALLTAAGFGACDYPIYAGRLPDAATAGGSPHFDGGLDGVGGGFAVGGGNAGGETSGVSGGGASGGAGGAAGGLGGGAARGVGGGVAGGSGESSGGSVSGGTAGLDGGQAGADIRDWALWPVTPDSPTNYVVSLSLQTVTDNVTGLMWQRNTNNWTFRCIGSSRLEDTLESVCSASTLDGYSDWRAPTRIELSSTIDSNVSMAHLAMINSAAFPSTPEWEFCTRSRGRGPQSVWQVHFGSGQVRSESDTSIGRIRCVRGGAIPSVPHYAVGPDTVRDQWTTLTWERTPSGQRRSLSGAVSYCQQLSLGGLPSGWQVPTRKELETLVKVPSTNFEIALDTTAFPDTGQLFGDFWTSSHL